MGQNTRSQGLAAFKFNMAAHFGHFRIPQKNSQGRSQTSEQDEASFERQRHTPPPPENLEI